MNNDLTIPKSIKVGFQNRTDTYTGKLAYVVYVDNKGVTRKEKSWEGWRDKTIDPIEYDNVPKDGFVLNRDVGGTRRSYGWDARVEKVRVFDRDGFEFEISIPNLLFILQECSAIKGKGLEGEFVYSWSGSELILLPVSSNEYKESVKHNLLQVQKVVAKDVISGCTYVTKDHQNVMYLGRDMWYEYGYDKKGNEQIIGKKKHIFINLGNGQYWIQDGFTKLATKTSESVVPQFADAFDAYKKSPHSSKQCQLFVKESKGSLVEYTYNDDSWKARASYCLVEDGKYYLVSISSQSSWDRNGKEIPKKDIKYNIKYNTVVEINKDGIMFKRLNCTVNPKYASGYYGYGYVDRYIVDKEDKNDLTLDQINSIVRELWVKCENGAEFRVGSL